MKKNFMKLLATLVVAGVFADQCQEFTRRFAEFRRIRVHFEFVYDDRYTILTNGLLPSVQKFIEEAVSVRSNSEPIRFPRVCRRIQNGVCIDPEETKCGRIVVPGKLLSKAQMGGAVFPDGPGVDADIVVFVTVQKNLGHRVKAEAGACLTRDICGRPLAGQMNVSTDLLKSAEKTSVLFDAAVSTLIHEFFHILGFAYESFGEFRSPATMEPIVAPRPPPVYYKCMKAQDGRFKVEWDVGPKEKDTHKFIFVPQVVQPISVRGLNAAECRCPTDPTVKYTNEDIEYCMRHSNKCALAIVTPTVRAATQDYFGCPQAAGMEIENGFGVSCSGIHQSHWKQRLVNGELMTPTSLERAQFISPMTFALLEDSGWYKMNYGLVSQVSASKFDFANVFWGYHSGCPFLQDKCISAKGVLVKGNRSNFCLPTELRSMTCSTDRRDRRQCTDGAWRADIEIKTQLEPYSYSSEKIYLHGQKHFDYCPAFEPFINSECSPNARCFEISRFANDLARTTRVVDCLPVICLTRRSYEVMLDNLLASQACEAENQVVFVVSKGGHRTDILCAPPQIVCAEWKLPHLNHFQALPNKVPATAKRTSLDQKSAAALNFTSAIIFILMSSYFL